MATYLPLITIICTHICTTKVSSYKTRDYIIIRYTV